MELSDIRRRIDEVDDEILSLFLQRMDLSEAVAAYKKGHQLPILNKTREREILSRMAEKAGARERYVYPLYTTLFQLARTRQQELMESPTLVGAQIRASLSREEAVFPQTGTVACQGVEGGNSQAACDRLLPRGRIVYVRSFEAVFDVWNRAFASSAWCPSKTAPTAPSGRCMTFCSASAFPSSAPPAFASGTSFWPCPALSFPTLRGSTPISRPSASAPGFSPRFRACR